MENLDEPDTATEPDFAYERLRDTNEGMKGCYHCRYKECNKKGYLLYIKIKTPIQIIFLV